MPKSMPPNAQFLPNCKNFEFPEKDNLLIIKHKKGEPFLILLLVAGTRLERATSGL